MSFLARTPMRCLASMVAALLATAVTAAAAADSFAAFSELPPDRQEALRRLVAPPPLAQRNGPYSIPQYYLMYRGYKYEGHLDADPANRTYKEVAGQPGPSYGQWALDRNRPDWQEAMVRNWAELGLNSTHLNVYPVDGQLTLSPDLSRAIADFVEMSDRHGLRVGVRLDSLDETKLWTMHPANPQNRRSEYLGWVKEVAGLLRGKTAYYVLGDELTLKQPAPNLPAEAWTPQLYLAYFKEVAGAIKAVDPVARVCMFGASSGEWFNVLWMLENGYAEVGDGVAINHYDYKAVPKFIADRDRLAPGKLFLTNGVGYISAGTAEPRYPAWDPYSKHPTEQSHAAAIARTMFTWWDLGADVAPYYISLRNWEIDGKVYPRWYGFFGFEDFVVKDDQLSVRRYPGWHAFRTITHTFYNREQWRPAEFELKTDRTMARASALIRGIPNSGGAEELILMLWDDAPRAERVRVTLATGAYRHPVRIDLYDHIKWSDVPADPVGTGSLTLHVDVGAEPVIIRLFKTP